jgi:hypothetical protein
MRGSSLPLVWIPARLRVADLPEFRRDEQTLLFSLYRSPMGTADIAKEKLRCGTVEKSKTDRGAA